ncbi:MAG: ATP synthase F1 subunit epsilon [Ruminococcus sp.]|nr:ATP synthase F1 subunit epsilon [Ruminococcus sp.]
MKPFSLKIITPEKLFFEGETEQLIVKTAAGDIGILADHVPYVANLVSSPLRIREGEAFKEAAISGGLMRVASNEVVIVTPAVEWAEDIDVVRAQKAKELAERKIKQHESEKEFERAEQKLRRAMNRLVVAGRK